MKKILLSGLTLFLIGCGGGNNTKSNTISGKVVDGYVKGAKICLDLNNNFKCDENEPLTFSDNNGNYSLKITDNKEHIIISQGGIDTESNLPAITMYSNTKYKNITPLTSLAIKEGEEKVAEFFNISISDIPKDPMKHNEIKNIIKNIVDEFLINNKYEIPTTFTFVDIRNSIPLEENNQSLISQEENETNLTNEVERKEGTENTPPQINGNLTPPQIGE